MIHEQISSNRLIHIFGHKNPDLDSYSSAYAYAQLLKQLKITAKAFKLGEENQETLFVLNKFNMKKLPFLNKLESKAQVILVDHNDFSQSAPNIENSKIFEIIDHHRLTTKIKETVRTTIEPIGSTATIIYTLYKKYKLLPDKNSARLLLAAILSDTLILKSPTSTLKDKKATKELADFLSIDYEQFGIEILTAGTNIEGLSIENILKSDRKHYVFGTQKGSIANLNTLNIDKVLKRKELFISALQKHMDARNDDFAILLISQILEKNCYLLVAEKNKLIHKSFSIPQGKQGILLPGVISRKKQVVPQIEQSLNKVLNYQ